MGYGVLGIPRIVLGPMREVGSNVQLFLWLKLRIWYHHWCTSWSNHPAVQLSIWIPVIRSPSA